MQPNIIKLVFSMNQIFNRLSNLWFIILFVALVECCKSPQQVIKENTITQNTTYEELDDTTTIITETTVTSIPTVEGGTKTTTNENKKIIKHNKKRGNNTCQVSKDEQKVDGLTPILEKEKTKRIKSNNKTTAKVAKEERKTQQSIGYRSFITRIIIFFAVGLFLFLWAKKK